MEKINWRRALFGGLVAGLVVNVFILGPSLAAAHPVLGAATHQAVGVAVVIACVVFVVTTLLTSIYAASRKRFGAGPRAAFVVGVGAGLSLAVFEYLGWVLTSKLTPTGIWAAGTVITFVALVVAALVGAWVYDGPSK